MHIGPDHPNVRVDSPRPTVTVAVLTFRRPEEVSRGLPAVLEQVVALGSSDDGEPRATVLVVDNDQAGTARSAVAAIASPLVRYVVEPMPGIAAARNRALDESRESDLLVFIDDDERPRPDWLQPLIRTWSTTNATIVMGRVVSQFEGELDPWIVAGSFFTRRSMPTGTEIEVAAAGNMLIDMRQIRRLGVRFDQNLGLGGGEDTLFSHMVRRGGGRIYWCEESVATDFVPLIRMTRRWVLRRSWSHGNALVLVALHLNHGRTRGALLRVGWVFRGLVRVATGAVRFCLGVLTASRRHQARGLRTLCRGAGMTAAAAGVRYKEYARTDQ